MIRALFAALPLTLALAASAIASPQDPAAAAKTVAPQTPDKPAPAPELQVERLSAPPVLDGVLDDEAWKRPPLNLGDSANFPTARSSSRRTP